MEVKYKKSVHLKFSPLCIILLVDICETLHSRLPCVSMDGRNMNFSRTSPSRLTEVLGTCGTDILIEQIVHNSFNSPQLWISHTRSEQFSSSNLETPQNSSWHWNQLCSSTNPKTKWECFPTAILGPSCDGSAARDVECVEYFPLPPTSSMFHICCTQEL